MTIWNTPPPGDICNLIFGYLKPDDLLLIYKLNKTWNKYCSKSAHLNNTWWQLCMLEWYELDQRPAQMTKVEKKKCWKAVFLRIAKKPPPTIEKKQKTQYVCMCVYCVRSCPCLFSACSILRFVTCCYELAYSYTH